MPLHLRIISILLAVLSIVTLTFAQQRNRHLVEWANRDCTGDSSVCRSISSGDCCVGGIPRARSGRCRDCQERDRYLTYSGGRCRNEERLTRGDTCVNVQDQTGQRWQDGYSGGGTEGKTPCANSVEPDLVSIGGRWFTMNGSMAEADRLALWALWGRGVPVPEDLAKYEVLSEPTR